MSEKPSVKIILLEDATYTLSSKGWQEIFIDEQIKNLHKFLHFKKQGGRNGMCNGPEGRCMYPDPKQILCGKCETFSFEAKRADDEHDTYIWIECKTCKYQYGVSH